MDVVLVPGLWLHGSSWSRVVPLLEQAGHRVQALTLPGMEGADADRSGIALADHVAAVVAALDAAQGPVLLVGHSLGGAVAQGALDARPEAVARIVYVGGFPESDGATLLGGLPTSGPGGSEVTMPDWAEVGEEANIVDFGPEELERFYAEAIPSPAAVLAGPQRLTDERRLAVPATLVCPEYTAAQVQEWVAAGDLPEVSAMSDVTYVDLPGGHWPQLTQPEALARVLLVEADR
jgi:pimeloyl-ACP methyl ester carboxylesterase